MNILALHNERSENLPHVVWDWNGTLLDDTAACVHALNRLLHRHGVRPVTETAYRNDFGFPVRDYYRRLGLLVTPESWEILTREYHVHYAETSLRAPLRRGAREALETLRRARIRMSILSACETGILERMLMARGIRPFFQHVYGLPNLDADSKLDIGKTLMAQLGVPSSRVLLVGDTCHDWEVAEILQCQCVLLAGGHQATWRLQECPCEVIVEFEHEPETGWDRLIARILNKASGDAARGARDTAGHHASKSS